MRFHCDVPADFLRAVFEVMLDVDRHTYQVLTKRPSRAARFVRQNGNYAAYVPDLPGCVATGGTRDEVARNIREAIEFHIEGTREDGLPVPEPRETAAVP